MLSVVGKLAARSNPRRAAQFGTAAYEKISSSDLQRLNRTSAGLYRLLLRESKTAASILGRNQNSKDLGGNLLLQPPVDQRDYGRTRSLRSSCTSWEPSPEGGGGNSNAGKIVSFFHRWGGTAGSVEGKDSGKATKLMLSHIPSSYEHLIPPKKTHTNSDSDGEEDGDDDEEEEVGPYQYILVSAEDLVNAVRSSFVRVDELSNPHRDAFISNLTKDDIVQLQRRVIDAVPLLYKQINMCDCTSVAVDEERGVRIIATSRFNGKGTVTQVGGPRMEHMFVYRIRVENIGRRTTPGGKGSSEADDGEFAVQILGRKWRIKEDAVGDDEHDDDDDGHVQVINAPRTGVVGYHPVLKPGGDVFEYMSGCTIASRTGSMGGSFHMAVVDSNSRSAQVGDPLRAFDYEEGDDRLFEVPVATFALDANKE